MMIALVLRETHAKFLERLRDTSRMAGDVETIGAHAPADVQRSDAGMAGNVEAIGARAPAGVQRSDACMAGNVKVVSACDPNRAEPPIDDNALRSNGRKVRSVDGKMEASAVTADTRLPSWKPDDAQVRLRQRRRVLLLELPMASTLGLHVVLLGA